MRLPGDVTFVCELRTVDLDMPVRIVLPERRHGEKPQKRHGLAAPIEVNNLGDFG
jgi:hypothetical protein